MIKSAVEVYVYFSRWQSYTTVHVSAVHSENLQS